MATGIFAARMIVKRSGTRAMLVRMPHLSSLRMDSLHADQDHLDKEHLR